MKDASRQQFRWAAHTSGVTLVRSKDYEPGGSYDSPSPYALWDELQTTAAALQVGDLLEPAEHGPMLIFKYVGFEPADWDRAETAATARAVSAVASSS